MEKIKIFVGSSEVVEKQFNRWNSVDKTIMDVQQSSTHISGSIIQIVLSVLYMEHDYTKDNYLETSVQWEDEDDTAPVLQN